MAFKMKGWKPFDKDKKVLRKAKRKAIKEEKKEFKSGDITRKQLKEAKKEIRGYTDVDVAREYLEEEKQKNSPQKVSKQLVKKGLKTGAKVVGKRILKTALGPVGLAWDAYDVAKAANKWRKKRRK